MEKSRRTGKGDGHGAEQGVRRWAKTAGDPSEHGLNGDGKNIKSQIPNRW